MSKRKNWNNISTGASILWDFSGSCPVRKSSERRVVQVRQQEISTVQLDASMLAARDSHWGAQGGLSDSVQLVNIPGLVNIQIARKIAIDIVDLAMKNSDFP